MFGTIPDFTKCRVGVGLLVLAMAGCQSAAPRQMVRRSLRPLKMNTDQGAVSDTDELPYVESTPDTGIRQASNVNIPLESGEPVEFVNAFENQKVSPDLRNSGGSDFGLTEAVSISLSQNPDLIAARGQEQVSLAAQDVAGTYPWNPFVQSQLLPGTGGSHSTQTSYYVWLMQRFELAHQQRYREGAAAALLNQVRWNIHQVELLNVAQTSRLYFTAQYQAELYRLANETADLNETLLAVVQRRFKAGLANSAAVTTAEVAARQSRRQAHLAEATYQAAVLAVRQQLNLPIDTSLSMSERLSDYKWREVTGVEAETDPQNEGTVDAASLAADLVRGRPDLLAAQSGISAAFANYELANAARMPDVQAGPILNTSSSGAETVGVRFQMELPIWNTGKPLANQRWMEQNQQALVYRQLLTRATLEAQMAIDRYERARRLAQESQVDLSPIAENPPPDLQSITSQFEAGQADVLAVFATQNSLLQERRTYLDLLNEVAQSAAGVVQATGLPLDRLVNRPGG